MTTPEGGATGQATTGEARSTWLDMTIRTVGDAEVTPQPDGTVEVSWTMPELESSRVTVLISSDSFRSLIEQGKDLLMMGTPIAALVAVLL